MLGRRWLSLRMYCRGMATLIDVSDLIDEIETVWIPLDDGRRLAARLFLPKSAAQIRVPLVLEYIPYRRRDGTRLGDETMHRWFAAHGYAAARVDIAGSGDSDGLLEDEYVLREQLDALQVIAWLAAQPWCSGSVGIVGISWGGFNGLQIAALRPPALRAVISLCSVVDRYHGDVHFTGGCLNEENLEWGGCLFTMNAFPPDPDIVGLDRWREMWKQRLDDARLAPADWLEHQRRDEFWKQGSVNEDYSAIEVPVLAISGWADGYTPAVPALVENLGQPSKGIVGPWGHKYPHDGVPGPAIGFLQEATRWWDRWLRDIDTGVETDPPLRLWLQQPMTPRSHHPHRPGQWIGLEAFPEPTSMYLASGRLLATPGESTLASIHSPLTTGLQGGQWCAYGQGKIAPELAMDQRSDDAGSLTYDTDVLSEAITLVGTPVVTLRVSSDQPVATIAIRLNDVHPDGSVERLTYGVLNLCHRDSHENPTMLAPGEAVDISLELRPMAQVVPAGHRLRLSISTSYWPMLWPSPAPVTLTISEASSRLHLPIVDSVIVLDDPFESPEAALAGPVTVVREGSERRQTLRDIGERLTTFTADRDDGLYVLDDIGTELSFTRVRSSSIIDDEPLSAISTVACTASFRRGDWDVRVESDIQMSCTATAFNFTARLAAYDAGAIFAERLFTREIPRDHL